MSSRSYLFRAEQLIGDRVATLAFKDPIESDTATVYHEQYAQYGAPLRLHDISGTAQSATDRDWPYDGDGVLDAVSDPYLTLNYGVVGQNSEDMVGLLIVMLDGTAEGYVRRITEWNPSTCIATCNRVWAPDPTAGDHYALLIDCFRHNQLHVKGEIVTGSTNTLTFIPAFYDVPQEPDGSDVRAPRRFEDQPIVLVSNGHAQGCTNPSGYQHLSTYSVLTRGALGAKIRVTAADADYQLWAGAA
jgi:hypothetical protein